MRKTTVKRIDDLVKDLEVCTQDELDMESKTYSLKRRKKNYWNKLGCDERSIRSSLIK